MQWRNVPSSYTSEKHEKQNYNDEFQVGRNLASDWSGKPYTKSLQKMNLRKTRTLLSSVSNDPSAITYHKATH